MGIYLGPFRITRRGVRVRVGPRIARLHIGAGRPGISTGAGPFTVYKSLGRARRSGGGPQTRGGWWAHVLVGVIVLGVGGAIVGLFGGGGSGTPAGNSVAASAASGDTGQPANTATPTGALAAPVVSHSVAPPAAVGGQSATRPGSCHPLTNGGKCYEPGEFCRVSDQGVTGLAGDGETIVCENDNGLRWVPVSGPAPAGSSAPSGKPTSSPKPTPRPTTPPPTMPPPTRPPPSPSPAPSPSAA